MVICRANALQTMDDAALTTAVLYNTPIRRNQEELETEGKNELKRFWCFYLFGSCGLERQRSQVQFLPGPLKLLEKFLSKIEHAHVQKAPAICRNIFHDADFFKY